MSTEPQRKQYEPNVTINVFDLLTTMGYRFSLDFDDEVLIEKPETLDLSKMDEMVQNALWQIQCRLRGQRSRSLRGFVGGPLAGRNHKGPNRVDGKLFMKIGPKQWACYQHQLERLEGIGYTVSDDPRLYFRGMATSEKNARQGRYIEARR